MSVNYAERFAREIRAALAAAPEGAFTVEVSRATGGITVTHIGGGRIMGRLPSVEDKRAPVAENVIADWIRDTVLATRHRAAMLRPEPKIATLEALEAMHDAIDTTKNDIVWGRTTKPLSVTLRGARR